MHLVLGLLVLQVMHAWELLVLLELELVLLELE